MSKNLNAAAKRAVADPTVTQEWADLQAAVERQQRLIAQWNALPNADRDAHDLIKQTRAKESELEAEIGRLDSCVLTAPESELAGIEARCAEIEGQLAKAGRTIRRAEAARAGYRTAATAVKAELAESSTALLEAKRTAELALVPALAEELREVVRPLQSFVARVRAIGAGRPTVAALGAWLDGIRIPDLGQPVGTYDDLDGRAIFGPRLDLVGKAAAPADEAEIARWMPALHALSLGRDLSFRTFIPASDPPPRRVLTSTNPVAPPPVAPMPEPIPMPAFQARTAAPGGAPMEVNIAAEIHA